jgi:hypothetical protein
VARRCTRLAADHAPLDRPVSIQRIQLVFEGVTRRRTQEFVLSALTAAGDREIVRQQFTFSPPSTTIEREIYATELGDVVQLELTIVPALDDAEAIATLTEWRVA